MSRSSTGPLAADFPDHARHRRRMARTRGDDRGIVAVDPFQRGRKTVGVAFPPDLAVGHDIDAGALHVADRDNGRIVLRLLEMMPPEFATSASCGCGEPISTAFRGPPANPAADSFRRRWSATDVSDRPNFQLHWRLVLLWQHHRAKFPARSTETPHCAFAPASQCSGRFSGGYRCRMQTGVTQTLAKYVVATRWEDIPAPVRHQAKRSLMNFFAVALAGCRTGPVEIALRSLAEFSGGKQATLVGRTERIDALSAAFLNAAGANVYDFCDTHTPHGDSSDRAGGACAAGACRIAAGERAGFAARFHPRQRDPGPHRAGDLAASL